MISKRSLNVLFGLIVFFILIATQLAHGSDWMIEEVDMTGDLFWNVDIECQDPNKVHMFYDRDWPQNDYYCVRDAYNWTNYAFPNFAHFDLELDSNGQPRMLTTQRPGTIYKLEYWQEISPGNWWYYEVADEISAGNSMLEIDSQDNAILAYIDRNTSSMKLTKITGDLDGYITTQTDTIATDPVFDTAQPLFQMILDNEDRPNIFWYEYENDALKRAHQPIAGGAWQVETAYTVDLFSTFKTAFDSANNLHLAYNGNVVTSNYDEIRHAVFDGTQWTDELASISGDRVGEIAIDSQDQTHIAYIDYNSGKDVFRYATDLGTHWHDEAIIELDSTSQGPEEMEMAVDMEGKLHLAFRGDADELRYARLDEPPRPQTTGEIAITVDVDYQAELSSGGGFSTTEGGTNIDVDRIEYIDRDDRGILEFHVDELDENVQIVSARLELDIWLLGHSSNGTTEFWPNPRVYCFEADGIVDPADAEKTSTLVGISEDIKELGMHSITLDPDMLNAQLADNPWLGLLLLIDSEDISFSSLESYSGTPATLILNVATTLPVPGDANGDGTVDADDAAILANHWMNSSGVTWAEGDFNEDGIVDDVDATIMAANWNTSAGSNVSVPEPQSLLLLLTAAMMTLCVRRK